MGPSDYSDAIRPLFYKDGEHIPNTIAALGLAGEAAEVTALFEEFGARFESLTIEDIKEFGEKLTLELGDTLWYVAALLDNLGYDCSEVDDLLCEHEDFGPLLDQLGGFNPNRLAANLSMHAGLAADIIKKAEWHGKELDVSALLAALCNVTVTLGEIGNRNGVTLGDITKANVEKLAKRYPGGFVEGGGVR